MAWLWSKLTLRRQLEGDEARQELLGYPAHSWELLFDALRDAIEAGGGRVLIDRPAAALRRGRRGGFVVAAGAPGLVSRRPRPARASRARRTRASERYDAVVATVPSDVFAGLLDDDLAGAIGAVVPRPPATPPSTTPRSACCSSSTAASRRSTGRTSPTRELPFVGLVEHTNFIAPERYDGRRFLYVANYLAPGDPLLALDPDGAARRLPAGPAQASSRTSRRDWIEARWLHREPAAQPIVTVGYHRRIPPLQTGVPGLVLANTTQIYPEDRGTNYSVRLGADAARALLSERP